MTTGVLSESSPVVMGLYAIERLACATADRINVLTPAFRDNIVRRGLASADKIVFVPNGADADLFEPGPRDNAIRRELGWGERFVVMYCGAHGLANALMQLVEAAALLEHRQDILFACVGDGIERQAIVEAIAQRGLTNIICYGPQPKERMPDFVRACDVGAAVLQNNPTFRTVYPNKVFDYMACERPTLLAIDGVARELVCEQAQAGVFAQPEDPVAIARAVEALASDPDRCRAFGKSGRQWVMRNATRRALAERYVSVMRDLVDSRAGS